MFCSLHTPTATYPVCSPSSMPFYCHHFPKCALHSLPSPPSQSSLIFTHSNCNLPKWCSRSLSSHLPIATYPNDVSTPYLHRFLLKLSQMMCLLLMFTHQLPIFVSPTATYPNNVYAPDLHIFLLQVTQLMCLLPIFTPSYHNLLKWCICSLSSHLLTATYPNEVSAPYLHTYLLQLTKMMCLLPIFTHTYCNLPIWCVLPIFTQSYRNFCKRHVCSLMCLLPVFTHSYCQLTQMMRLFPELHAFVKVLRHHLVSAFQSVLQVTEARHQVF